MSKKQNLLKKLNISNIVHSWDKNRKTSTSGKNPGNILGGATDTGNIGTNRDSHHNLQSIFLDI